MIPRRYRIALRLLVAILLLATGAAGGPSAWRLISGGREPGAGRAAAPRGPAPAPGPDLARADAARDERERRSTTPRPRRALQAVKPAPGQAGSPVDPSALQVAPSAPAPAPIPDTPADRDAAWARHGFDPERIGLRIAFSWTDEARLLDRLDDCDACEVERDLLIVETDGLRSALLAGNIPAGNTYGGKRRKRIWKRPAFWSCVVAGTAQVGREAEWW